MAARGMQLGKAQTLPYVVNNYTGIHDPNKIMLMTLGETIAVRTIVFLHTDGKVYTQDVTVAAEAKALLLFCLWGGNANDVRPCALEVVVKRSDFSGVGSIGRIVYADKATPGGWTQTYPPSAGDNIRPVGYCCAPTTFMFIGTLPWQGVVPA